MLLAVFCGCNSISAECGVVFSRLFPKRSYHTSIKINEISSTLLPYYKFNVLGQTMVIIMETTTDKMPQRAKSLFKSKETEDAFFAWLKIGGGINSHPEDVNRFYSFVYLFLKNKETISKNRFVLECKKFTHTTHNLKRGICQNYYTKLTNVEDFVKTMDIDLNNSGMK